MRYWIRLKLLAVAPFLALDCVGNWIFCDGSIRNTMSGEAWHSREHAKWGWTHKAIDIFFRIFGQQDHCKVQAEREEKFKGVWPAWADRWEKA